MADVDDLRRKLHETLDSAAKSGEGLITKGHDVSAAGQSIVDWAAATREGSDALTDPAAVSDLLQTWDRTYRAAAYLNIHVAGGLALVTSAGDASNVSSLLNLPLAATDEKWTSFAGTTKYDTALRIQALAKRPEAYESVLSLLKGMGFDRVPGGRLSPVDQFMTAHNEFRVGASSPGQATSWLIPMRECILTVIATLLQKRLVQEETKGTIEKVMSICNQLGRAGFEAGHFETLSTECRTILDEELSPSKQAAQARLQSGSVLFASTLWLKGFLSALDPEKLQKAAR